MIRVSWRDCGRDLWDGIRAQPARTGLSLFAIGVGAAALSVVLAALGGLQERARFLIREFGAQVFTVAAADDPPDAESGRWPRSAVEALRANLAGSHVAASTGVGWGMGRGGAAYSVVAADADLARVRRWPVVRGRFLDALDERDRLRHAVVTRSLSEREGWDLGRVVSIKGVPFGIVGVVAADRSVSGGAAGPVSPGGADEFVAYVPRSVRGLFGLTAQPGSATIAVRVPLGCDLRGAVARARRVLSDPSLGMASAAWVTPDALVAGIRRWQKSVGATAGAVSLLCLVLGGMTLMSLMVANVRERVCEIGLRRALGARPADIAALFVAEACLLTCAAALAATAGAHGLLRWVRGDLPFPVRLDATTCLLPVAVSVALGGLFAYGPARSAAALAPADALRSA